MFIFLLQDQQDLHALYLDGSAIVNKLKVSLQIYKTKNFFKINTQFLKGITAGINQVNIKLIYVHHPVELKLLL